MASETNELTNRPAIGWRRALHWFGWSIAYLFVTAIVFTIIAINAEALHMNRPVSEWSAAAGALLLGFVATKWWRYQIVHKEEIVATRKERELAGSRFAAASSKPNINSGIGEALLIIIGAIIGIVVIGWIAIEVLALLPISAAIILGSVIIAIAILAGLASR